MGLYREIMEFFKDNIKTLNKFGVKSIALFGSYAKYT